jgi:hypothetical protein
VSENRPGELLIDLGMTRNRLFTLTIGPDIVPFAVTQKLPAELTGAFSNSRLFTYPLYTYKWGTASSLAAPA